MKIVADADIPFARPVVFATYRDRLLDLVPYLANIRGIEMKSREEEAPGVTRFVNVWHGGGDIPRAARAVISDAMLSWNDYAAWYEKDWRCDWRIEPHSFTEAIRCQGQNYYYDAGGGSTRLEIRGELSIDAKKIKLVPKLFAGKVERMVEDFLGARIQPNLVETSKGVIRFLQDRHGTP